MKEDIINVEILPDGTIKMETDKVSMPNHQNAEQLLRDIGRMCGGKVERKRRVHLGASLSQALHDHTHDGHTHSH